MPGPESESEHLPSQHEGLTSSPQQSSTDLAKALDKPIGTVLRVRLVDHWTCWVDSACGFCERQWVKEIRKVIEQDT